MKYRILIRRWKLQQRTKWKWWSGKDEYWDKKFTRWLSSILELSEELSSIELESKLIVCIFKNGEGGRNVKWKEATRNMGDHQVH